MVGIRFPRSHRGSHGSPDGRSASSNYLQPAFTAHLDPSGISRIFEPGSRDGHDAIHLRDFFDADVTAFECNLEAIRLCRHNLRLRRGAFEQLAHVFRDDWFGNFLYARKN